MHRGARVLLAVLIGWSSACSAERTDTGAEAAPSAEPAASRDVAADADIAAAGDDQKTIYALGYSLAGSVAAFQLSEEELAHLQEGLGDAVLEREPKVPLGEYRGKIQALARTRRMALASVEEEKGQAWIAEVSAEQGVVTKESGLVMQVTEPGEGPSPTATARVRVHYHGTLRDGTVFDSSVERGEPAVFPVNRVIPCWTEALQLMSVGGKARILCPAKIAYGERGRPPHIKPGATLAFDVELIEVVQEQ